MKKIKWLNHNDDYIFIIYMKKILINLKLNMKAQRDRIEYKNIINLDKYNNIISKNKNFNIEVLTDDEINNILEHYRKIIKQKNCWRNN